MREFARNISAVIYKMADKPYRAIKVSKNEWQLPEVQAGDAVTVSYEVYCYDLSVRTAYVDGTRIYGNFTSLALAISGQENQTVQVRLNVPQAFIDVQSTPSEVKLACGLSHSHLHNDNTHIFTLDADHYHELIDYPFEIAMQDEFDFIVHDAQQTAIAHRFFLSGKQSSNLGRLQTDLTKICQTYLDWLGDAPFTHLPPQNYTFMTFASGNDYGGLEHINSTSLITPRSDLPKADEPDEPSEGYQRFLGLCSHEYFHAWWVKTVRPDVMLNADLRAEAYTPLLWVFEGFTSYVDDFMLQASSVISTESYLKLLASQINRYEQTAGRALQSVAESSFDAWIKLYRADENTGNAGISYYNKGALVALCLDLTLLKVTEGKYRIFALIKAFYEQAKAKDNLRVGMSEASLDAVMNEMMGADTWQNFAQKYVTGLEPLPINELLAEHGVTLAVDDSDNTLPWGMTVTETGEGLKVSKVLRDSVASEAGISAKDVIVAIDGIKASKKQLKAVAESQANEHVDDIEGIDNIVCHAFRRDELMTFTVSNQTASGTSANPSLGKVTLQVEGDGNEVENWLRGGF